LIPDSRRYLAGSIKYNNISYGKTDMEEEHYDFCTKCGTKVSPTDEYCPSCGNHLHGGACRGMDEVQKTTRSGFKDYLPLVTVLSILWAIIALMIGFELVFGIDGVMSALKDSSQWSVLIEYYTESEIRNMLIWFGYISLVGGIATSITAALCGTRKYYPIALISCLVASVFSMLLLVGLIGIIVLYLIVLSKAQFTN
jgi:hypothetical protein